MGAFGFPFLFYIISYLSQKHTLDEFLQRIQYLIRVDEFGCKRGMFL